MKPPQSPEDKLKRSRQRLAVLEGMAENPRLPEEQRRVARNMARSQRAAVRLRERAVGQEDREE